LGVSPGPLLGVKAYLNKQQMEGKKQFTLKAVYGKQQGTLLLSPVRDRITGRLKGVKELSEEERRKERRPVTAGTQRKISDGLTIDLNNEIDQVDWDWIKYCDEIVPSFEDAQNNPKALFYIDQPDMELEKRLERNSRRFEAEKYIRESTPEQREEIARYLGQNISYMRPQEILDWLLSRLDTKNGPADVMKSKTDPKFKTRLFLYKLMDIGKVKKNVSGMFYYGEIVLGLTADAAVNWLDDPNNRDIVGKLYIELYGGDDTVFTSVIDEFESQAKPKKAVAKDKKAGKAGEAAGGDSGLKFEEEEVL
jgi:hypothetical protein